MNDESRPMGAAHETSAKTSTAMLAPDMNAVEAHDITRRIRATAEQLWQLLAEAHDRRAWHALGYQTWTDYIRTEFAMSRGRSYQLLNQARVISEITSVVSTDVDITEAEARDIKPMLSTVADNIKTAVTDIPVDDVETRKAIVKAEVDRSRAAQVREQLAGNLLRQVQQKVVSGQRRRPLPDVFLGAIDDGRKCIERLARLVADDRFGSNRDSLRGRHYSDLIRLRTDLDSVMQAFGDGVSS